ncbi:GT2 family glycosyltransferase [Cytobacillus firmus]|uniref:GT2 family glycosyltransferase n=2 Tax=Cytobacillus TaxID=2675230 RepID=A0A366JNI5_CYTFI|nr:MULTISPECIES: glycosyltransferase [Cytobacillus]RBP88738.1 GT2 family glycosyltransferase [Cytobacillus firmus]TDX39523.1 GT2 family glycosyltransferase [Cytobacillus oceanisediminis]
MRPEKLVKTSLILPVKNEGIHIKNTILSILKTKTNHSYEIIVVDDGSEDQCCHFLEEEQEKIKLIKTNSAGAAKARNIGAEHASGKYFIFCDAHMFFKDYFIDSLVAPIENGIADAVNPGIADFMNPEKKGYGYTWNEQLEPKWKTDIKKLSKVPLLAGGCLAISKEVFQYINGFENGFKVWGREDEEISLKLWLMGYRCFAEPKCTVFHVFRTESPPFLITWEDVNYNLLRMAYSHFNEKRVEKCKKLIKFTDPDFVIDRVLKSDVMLQREHYFQKRVHDDDWFMNLFGINF